MCGGVSSHALSLTHWVSSHSHWAGMQEFARQHKMIFVPSIGPGYIDTAIRPWNAQNTREREDGAYYARGWKRVQAMQVRGGVGGRGGAGCQSEERGKVSIRLRYAHALTRAHHS